MKRKSRRRLVLAVFAAGAVGGWLLAPGPFSRGLVVGFVAASVVLLGGFLIFARRMKKRLNRALEPPPLPTALWDYQMELTDLDGGQINFSESSGTVLVLNFWATWCAPCIAEMPSFKRLIEATSDLDVRFGFVTREDSALVRRFVEKHGLELPIYLLAEEPPECFKGRAIPATFVLDRRGSIALRHFGAAAWDAESVVTFVRGLAATPVG